MRTTSTAILLALSALLIPWAAYAQAVPDSINYQGKLTDTSGQPVPDGLYNVQFKLYTDLAGGTPFWTSVATNVQTSGGVFTTTLQPLTPADFAGKTDVYLETLVAGSALAPRVKLTSAPFAMRSGDLTLPFAATIVSASTGFAVTNTGGGNAVKGYVGGSGDSGSAGLFQVTNPNDKNAALLAASDGKGGAISATSSGTGSAGWFDITNTTNSKAAIEAETHGTGNAGSFTINNASNPSPAVNASTNGSGPALKATAGTGVAGQFEGVLQATGFKLTTAPGDGYVLTSDATGAGTWQPGGLTLPFSESVSSASTAFEITNTGTGRAGHFRVSNNTSPADALFVESNADGDALQATHTGSGDAVVGYTSGTGFAGNFTMANSASNADAIRATTNSTNVSGDAIDARSSGAGAAVYGYASGTGRAGYFVVDNGSDPSDAVFVTSKGSGDTIVGNATGAGSAADFSISNAGSTADAVKISTNATSSAADGLYVSTTGGGNALYAYSSGASRAGYFQVNNSGGSADALFAQTNTDGDAFQATSTGDGNAIQGYMSGGGRAGYFRVVNAGSTEAALYAETNATSVTSAYAVYGRHSSSGNYGYIGHGQYAVYGNASGTSDTGVYGLASGNNGYGLYGYASYDAAGSANYGVRGTADGESGRGGYFTATGAYGRGIMASASNSGNYLNYGGHFTASGTVGIGIYAQGGTSGKAAVLRGNVELLDRTTGTTVMELGTGLDYAEGFDVSDGTRAEPGSVLVIDAQNAGKLALSSKPYDRCVAGIVAGAKNLGSGVRLGAGQFDHNVALAGRVYCNVDATGAGIQPGDLLTTSGTPGYAMRVTDHSRAQGAILGKAMQSLAKGRKGQILVLVTLQ